MAADLGQVALGHRARARARLADEERPPFELGRGRLPPAELDPVRGGDADELVVEKRLRLDPGRKLDLPGDSERELALGDPLRDPGARADRDVDMDPGMA